MPTIASGLVMLIMMRPIEQDLSTGTYISPFILLNLFFLEKDLHLIFLLT